MKHDEKSDSPDRVEQVGKIVIYGGLAILATLMADSLGLLEWLRFISDVLGIMSMPAALAAGILGTKAFDSDSAIMNEIKRRVDQLLPNRMLTSYGGLAGSIAFDQLLRTNVNAKVEKLLPNRMLTSYGGLAGSIEFDQLVQNTVIRRIHDLLPDDGMTLRRIINEEVRLAQSIPWCGKNNLTFRLTSQDDSSMGLPEGWGSAPSKQQKG